MSLQRKIKREAFRKAFGNKGMQYYWERRESLFEYIKNNKKKLSDSRRIDRMISK